MAESYRVEWLDNGSVDLRFRYDAGLVEKLKARIPLRYRTWCPDGKYWRISPIYADTAAQLLGEWFNEPNGSPRPKAPKRSPWRELWLIEGAPLAVVKAVYRALAGIHHPDVGGHTEDMKRINLAYEEIIEAVKK